MRELSDSVQVCTLPAGACPRAGCRVNRVATQRRASTPTDPKFPRTFVSPGLKAPGFIRALQKADRPGQRSHALARNPAQARSAQEGIAI